MKGYTGLLLFILIAHSAFSQKVPRYFEVNNQRAEEMAGYKNTKELIYFDVDGQKIKKSVFQKKQKTHGMLQVPGDSLHHRKLILREFHGQLTDHAKFIGLLETELDIKLNPQKPVVIVYYSGRNLCNATGSADEYSMLKWHTTMQAGILGKTNDVLYLYRKGEIPPKKYSLLEYKADPQRIAQQLFFPYDFPCESFVVISKTGKYHAYYGEYGNSAVWKAVDYVLDKG